MYAIVETGGKQYQVEEGTRILVEKLAVEPGAEVVLDKVLLIGGDDCKVGTPYLEGATVKAEVVAQGRGPKVLVFKRRRRKDSKSLHGHRQDHTALRIKSINS
ncbi:MAG: 50S ribosomal protein L21 [Desulfovibrio sp.]|uniref:50S ribosomal protein L21 n=1 Tax=Desulfovibrio sp. TaxID=885 RepID=UPI001A763D35|nr:50S ribosomal protein L21 [Desulfovibrio sp.]MBD5416143.1 50S ribosomal protein L21 [Desulfovibrio sp.]